MLTETNTAPLVGASAEISGGVPQTRTPVVRRGQLVRAITKRTGAPCTLDLPQSRDALKHLAAGAERAITAITDAMKGALPGRDLIIDPAGAPDLSPAGRVPDLGVVFNYREFEIKLGEARIVARPAVTLCITPPQLQDEPAGDLPLSKFWTRFILASHPALVEGANTELADAAIRQFDEDCTQLHAATMEALTPLYATALGAAMGQELTLNSSGKGSFSVLTLSASGGDVEKMFDAVGGGASFADQLRDAPGATSRLVQLAIPALAGDASMTVADAAEKIRAEPAYQFIFYDSGTDEQGIYILRAKDDQANFVGLALDRAEDRVENLPHDLSSWRRAAANKVSAGLIAQYARNF